METRKYRTYSKEFKLEALQLLENSEKSASELERELGVTTGLVGWRALETLEGLAQARISPIAQPDGRSKTDFIRCAKNPAPATS